MAVYTHLNLKKINQILKSYNIGNLTSFREIKEGIENTNYYLRTKKTRCILTIFEKRTKKRDVPFFINLMLKLKGKIKCPVPILQKKGKKFFLIHNKIGILVSFLEGKAKKKINLSNCKTIGKEIAKLHNITKSIKLYRKNNLQFKTWSELIDKSKNLYPEHSCKIQNILNFYRKNKINYTNLPNGIIHGDIFPDNIFFKKNRFKGFIDFYFSCNGAYIYDLAIAINSICFEKELNYDKVDSLISGYNSNKKILSIEKKYLAILCLGASIRFFSTRLYDMSNTPKNALVKKKDPNEYLKKMYFFYENYSKLTKYFENKNLY